MATIWTDEDCVESVDGVGFLVEVAPEGRDGRYQLRERPPHTNQSHEPRLHGWCGTTDNVAIFGRGLARVSRVTKNGRVQLSSVPATPELLEQLGYPELASQAG
jgi:hypothetical protein